ncbi:uncharacterized protein LOC133930920 [Phragmites australis]|uniref:uncharacterized protein LOC133930920 n=1 Tax=Phragmites australis TaxID=29695 RepID=UPI002D764F28|nr:uncharacterized protein LOC133930920 [Phragmites australis]
MDKILAFSILSSSPADIAAGGYSTRLSWRSSGGKQQEVERAPKQEKAERQSSRPVTERKVKTTARFAPEFDGINCFESIVSF